MAEHRQTQVRHHEFKEVPPDAPCERGHVEVQHRVVHQVDRVGQEGERRHDGRRQQRIHPEALAVEAEKTQDCDAQGPGRAGTGSNQDLEGPAPPRPAVGFGQDAGRDAGRTRDGPVHDGKEQGGNRSDDRGPHAGSDLVGGEVLFLLVPDVGGEDADEIGRRPPPGHFESFRLCVGRVCVCVCVRGAREGV